MKRTLLLLLTMLMSSITLFAQVDCSTPKPPSDNQVHDWSYRATYKEDYKQFKPFIINGLPFRLLYPKNFSTDPQDKKYPLMVLLNGIGEDGESTDCDNNLQLALRAGKRYQDAVNNGSYDGFVMAPQAMGSSLTKAQFTKSEQDAILAFITYAIKNLRVDEYRVQLSGYSAGGGAGWDMAYKNPKVFTAAIIMSAASDHHINYKETLTYTAVWLAQGGKDGAPKPESGDKLAAAYQSIGANFRYLFYPKTGHNTWDKIYFEPDLIEFVSRNSMLNIHVRHFKSNFCPSEAIQGTMGVKQGFFRYEWQKDGVTVQEGSNHELNFTETGSYRVRIKPESGREWSEWGNPTIIQQVQPTPAVTIQAKSSTALPTLDDKHFVTIKAPKADKNGKPYQSYTWYKDSQPISGEVLDSLVTSKGGVYTVVVTEKLGCPSAPSNAIKVTSGGVINSSLTEPANFTVIPVSDTELRLTWEDKSSNETSYELYGNRTNEAPWQLLAYLPANSTTFTHRNLNSYTRYFYQLRAVNNDGGTNYVRTDGKTLTSENKQPKPPTAPSNVTATAVDHQSILLKWKDNSNNETSFEISRSTSNTGTFSVVGTVGANVVQYTDKDLQPSTRYYYQLRALGSSGNSDPAGMVDGTWVNAQTTSISGGTTITAPSGLTAARQNAGSVMLQWQDNSNNEEGFEIYRNSSLLSKTGPNTTSYTDKAAGGTATYTYKIRAYKGSNTSSFSNSATIVGSNQEPVLVKIGTIYARYETISKIKLIGTDKDKDACTYSAENLPVFASISQNADGTATLMVQPTSEHIGTYEDIILKVTDVNGGSSLEKVSLVVGENASPSVMNVSSVVLKEKDTRTLEFRAYDGNGDKLSFTFEGAPSFMQFTDRGNNTGFMTISPNYGHAGEYPVIVKVTDPKGAANFTNFVVTVVPVNTSYKVSINFNDRFQEQAPAPWNNMANYPTTGANLNYLKDASGSTTPINVSIIDGFDAGEGGAATSTDAALPNQVLNTYYYGWDKKERKIKVSNLDPALTYSITIIGSKPNNEPVEIKYSIGGVAKVLDISKNQSIRFEGIAASTGEIVLGIEQVDPKYYSYISGLVIEASFVDNSAPLAPTKLTTALTASNLVQVSWLDNSFNETAYQLVRSTDGINFTKIIDLDANTTSFTDVDVQTGTTYYYKVKASNTSHSSAWSNVATIEIKDSETEPEDPLDTNVPTDPSDPGTDPGTNPGTDPKNTDPNAPVLGEFPAVLHAIQGTTKTYEFSLKDPNAGDVLEIITRYLPAFATATYNARQQKVIITLKPSLTDVGYYSGVQLTATDGTLETDVTFSISVTESEKNVTYVNFMYDYPMRASRPWNNTDVPVAGGATIRNLRNESNIEQPYVLSLAGSWNSFQPWGETAINNAGIYPNAVTKTAYTVNKGGGARIVVSNLDNSKSYNFVFFGSSVYKSLGGISHYKVNGETVSLPVQGNIENTVQINGVKPVKGIVTLEIYSVYNDRQYLGAFINALVIEEYPNTNVLASPNNFKAYAVSKTQVDLKWVDRSKGEEGFEIYKRTLPSGKFIPVHITGPNATTYSDKDLKADTGYEYYVAAVKGNSRSESSEIRQAATLKFEVKVNVNNKWAYNAPSPWINLNQTPSKTSLTWNNLKNESGKDTGIDLGLAAVFDGENAFGEPANGQGIYPDNVIKSFYFTEAGNIGRFRVSDLDPSAIYNFRFMSSIASTVLGNNIGGTVFRIGNKQVHLDAQYNISNTAVIRDVVAPNGEIFIEVESAEYSQYGLINAIVIEARDGAKETNGASPSAKYLTEGETATAAASLQKEVNEVTTVYPNPMKDELYVNFLAKQKGTLTLQVMDLQGRTVYLQEVQAQEGDNIFRLDFEGARINKGLYILRIKSMDFTSKVVRFMKQ